MQRKMVGFRKEYIAPIAALIIPLTVYLFTMPPGLTWAHNGADGGDLITAAVTLGVPHPSGYPTYTLLGWLVSRLPFGTPAWRFNLLSALATAGAAFWVYRIIADRTGNRDAGVIGAWAFALTPLVWGQAIIAEVYGVNLFFVGLLLWLLSRAGQGGRNFFAVGLVFGLALGTHLTAIFWLPVIVYRLLAVSRRRSAVSGQRSARNLKLETRNACLGFLLGMGIFLYLPLRAGQGAITWGEPDTLGGFWALVSGQIYRGYLFSAPIESLARRIPALARYFISSGIVPLALAGLGGWRLWRQNRALTLAAGLSVGGYSVAALGYATADSFIYLLPVVLAMSIAVGWGMVQLLADVPSRGHGLTIAVVGVVLLAGVGVNWKSADLRHDTAAEQFWQSVLADAPPDAVLLTDTDRTTFALWYARFALGKRPDVTVVDTRLAAFAWHRADLRRRDPNLTHLAEIDTIFVQQKPYPRPLCRVYNSEQSVKWSLLCNR